MMDYLARIIGEIETHSVTGIKECFEHGLSPNAYFRGEPLIYELTSEYGRTPRFKECVRAFVDYGLSFEDEVLLAVLLDDATYLRAQLDQNEDAIRIRYTLRCAYTPLHEASLLHICAEFNHLACAQVLVARGAAINIKAGSDGNGFGGQTPIFHTVNQNSNNSWDMLNFLLAQGADVSLTVTGLIWGKGYEWETFIPAVNPLSYAMMGLLPQMHRDEATIAKTVSLLLKAGFDIDYMPPNIPCAYLK